MNIKELLQNKTVLYSVIGGVCALIFIIILVVCLSVGGKSSTGEVIDKIEKEQFLYKISCFSYKEMVKIMAKLRQTVINKAI